MNILSGAKRNRVLRKQKRKITKMSKLKCPVCEKYYFSEIGVYEDCPICDWTQDSYQEKFSDKKGANNISLNEARKRYTASEDKVS